MQGSKPGTTEESLAVRSELDREGVAALAELRTPVLLLGGDGRIRFANRAWERLSSADAEEFLGQPFWDAFPAWCGVEGEALIRASLSDGAARHYRKERGDGGGACEMSFARAGRGVLVVEALAQSAERPRPRREPSDEDAALRRLARQLAAVADSAELLERLCESARAQCAADGAAVVRTGDEEGVVLGACGATVWARGARVPLAASLTERVATTRRVVVENDYEVAYAARRPHLGGMRIGSAMGAPLLAAGRVLGVVSVWRGPHAPPFTEGDEARLRVIADYASLVLWKALLLEEAQAANRAKADFLASISHELRTPLTALTGYGELLVDQVLGPLQPGQLEIVERMRTVTNHLTVMIDEILTFAGLEAGHTRVHEQEVAAEQVIREALTVVTPFAEEKRLPLAVHVEGDIPPLRTDPDRVRQILVNLLGNGIKFTDRGRVDVRLTTHGGEVRVAITDTGIGIPRESFPQLFRPFSQLEGGLTRRHGGTGLGLHIARRLAELIGARIELTSEVGAGSTFTLVLPTVAG